MNLVVMVARLTKDPTLRYIAGSGKAVCTFTIAVDRPFAKEKTADFFNVVVWGKTGENAANYLEKGRQVAVKGYLQTRNYEDNGGVKRYVTEIVADTVEFIGNALQNKNESTTDEFEGFESIENTDDCPF